MIERKIEKIINNYLYKKVIHIFKGRALIRGIDLHIIPRKDKVTVYAKDRRFTENLYKEVFPFNKDASIYYLCNLKETSKEFDEILKTYQEIEVK